jgi:spore coat protein CotH
MDPTLTRESVAFAIYRAAGVPAPRTAYAEITFNVPGLYENASGGFYTLIENVNKPFLRRALPPGTGLLMKPEGLQGGIQFLGNSWASYVPVYRPDREATPHEQQRVIEFTRLVSQDNDALFREKIRTYLDVDEFLRFIAVTSFIMNKDSYLNGSHNFYLYLGPKDDKFRFIPWDVDKSMPARGALVPPGANTDGVDKPVDILQPSISINITLVIGLLPPGGNNNNGVDILQPSANNILISRLLDDPSVAEEYRAIVKELAGSVFTAQALNKKIADVEEVIPNRDPSVRTFLNTRSAYVQSLVAGLEK